MCGITGYWSAKTHHSFDEMTVLKLMAQALQSRGPDGEGYWTNRNGLFLAHRRLSIVDLSLAGHQPMPSGSGRFQLVFNGEIYNHTVLRAELKALLPNYEWVGHSDTEVILACFEAFGVEQTLTKLSGMFACAVWDNQDKLLYITRDKSGEKPLYYGWNNGYFLFGSELAALKQHPDTQLTLNKNAIYLYTKFGYVPTPHSVYEKIYKLPPGSFIAIHQKQLEQGIVPEAKPYWSFHETLAKGQKNPFNGTDTQAIDKLEHLLQQAIESQMMADVPVGAFLSGGIDSSTIVALMQSQSTLPIKTFTIGYESNEYNEAVHAAAVAKHLKTEHSEWYITDQDALNIIPKIPLIYSEPFADSSQIPTTLVSRLARTKVKVSLSGDAGDELFGGYNRYIFANRFLNRLNPIPVELRKLIASVLLKIPVTYFDNLATLIPKNKRPRLLGEKISKIARSMAYRNIDDFYHNLVSMPQYKELASPCSFDFTEMPSWAGQNSAPNPIDWMMAQDFTNYLVDDILVKVDRAAMSESLESRVPFLDPQVIAFASEIPLNMKIRHGSSKWIVKEVLYRHVPQSLVDRPKMGFGVPIDAWLRGPLSEWGADLLDKNKLMEHGLFDTDVVNTLWSQHLKKTHNHQHQLWTVLMFQSWFQHNF